MFKKKISRNLKARIRKSKKDLNINIKNFFDWVKGAELIQLKECDIKKDPVRPELDNEFRTSYGRKIYGVKYKGEIYAVMCFAFTNQIPKSVKELDKLSKDAFLQSALRDQKVGKIKRQILNPNFNSNDRVGSEKMKAFVAGIRHESQRTTFFIATKFLFFFAAHLVVR